MSVNLACKINNQMFFSFNVFIFENKNRTSYDNKYCNIKLFSGAISHGVSNESEVYLELSQKSMRELFTEIATASR